MEALYFSIMENDREELCASAWVEQLADRLQLLREEAALGTAHAIERRKTQHDKGTKLREFQVGEKVKYRILGMLSSLSESWDGPFIIQEKIGSVNYRIGRDSNKSKGKVVHVSNIMKYV